MYISKSDRPTEDIKSMIDKMQVDRLQHIINQDNHHDTPKFDWYSFCIGLAAGFLIIGIATITHPPRH